MNSFWTKASLGLLASAAFGAMILGCGGSTSGSASSGGGSGGFQGLTPTPITAQITLPGKSASGLKAWTSAGEKAAGSDGKVGVTIFNNGPQFTQVTDASGRMVVGGFLSKDKTVLDAESTAQMLAYFAVGGPLQRGKTSSVVVLNGVKSMPGFDQVKQAVTTALTADGFIAEGDPQIKAALDNMRSAVLAGSKGRSASRGPDVDPTTSASGLDLNNEVDEQIQITNNLFRRCYFWLERTGFKDDNGNVRDLNDGVTNGWILLPGRYGGSVDSATGLIKGQYAWQPAAMDPIPVASDIADVSNEQEIYYKLTTVGPGSRAGDFDDITTEQFGRWEESIFWSTYLDFFVPVFANIIVPLDGDAIDSFAEFAMKDAEAQAFITSCRSSMKSVTSLTAQGKFAQAVQAFVSSSQTESVTVPVTAKVFLKWAQKFGSGLFVGQSDLENRVGVATTRINMIDLAAATAEMAPLMDIAQADQANIFKITSSKSKVSLQPDQTEIGLNETTDIVAVIKNKNPNVTYRYEWTVAPNSNYFLNDPDGNATDESPGGILKTSHEEVFIGGLTNNEGTATVTCRVLVGNDEVGTATTRISFKNKVQKGTATFRVEGRVLGGNGGGYGTYVLCIAQVPKVEGAAHYALLVEDEKGADIARANWDANNEPRKNYDAELWKKKPADAFWYVFDGINTAYISSLEEAEESMAKSKADLAKQYENVKFTVTVYFE